MSFASLLTMSVATTIVLQICYYSTIWYVEKTELLILWSGIIFTWVLGCTCNICQLDEPHRVFALIILYSRYVSSLSFHVKLVAVHDVQLIDSIILSLQFTENEPSCDFTLWSFIIVGKVERVYEEAIFPFVEFVEAWIRCLIVSLIVGKRITRSLVQVLFVKSIVNIKSYLKRNLWT